MVDLVEVSPLTPLIRGRLTGDSMMVFFQLVKER